MSFVPPIPTGSISCALPDLCALGGYSSVIGASILGTSLPSIDGSTLGTLVHTVVASLASIWPDFGWLSGVVTHATGWPGLGIVFVYSFLIAFALPGVSEIVLFAPLELGLTEWGRLTVIILVSGIGKAAGSVFAFHIGQEAKQAGPIVRALERSRFDVIGWSERRTIGLAQRYGYAGLALALCVPGFPDTLSIYAFAVLEEDYLRFAAATFVGSVGRLVVTVVGIEAVLFLV